MYADMIIRLHAINGSTGLPSTNAVAMDGIGFKLHRIIAVRSPYLASLLNEAEVNGDHYQPHPVTITVPTNDPNLSPDGISMALGHLYASFAQTMLAQHSMQSPVARSAFLRSCLAAANLFHLQDLAAMVTDYIKGDISRATVLEYCRFVSQQEWGGSYGTSQQIRECVLEYLHKGIVRELAELAPVWGNKDGETYRELVKTFADLPFDWLKRVVESRSFEVPSDMERFTFAKEIVQLRARNKHSGSTAMAGEENVLLAFGANKSGGSGVTIVRKAAKGVHHSGVNGMGGGMGRQGGYPPQRTVWKAGPGL
ncbi:hypothetical protein HK104_005736 [Borealophlyctis nickersoniae]|nr:hypothetical protein HK104_005736 [Borealophlyctis nickersoniae]